MSNTPPDNNKPDDPWGQGDNTSTPDFNKVLNDIKSRFSSLLGNKAPEPNTPEPRPNMTLPKGAKPLLFLLVAVVVAMASGLFRVDTNQRAAVLHLGDVVRTVDAGWHWHLPGLQRVAALPAKDASHYQQTVDLLAADNQLVRVSGKVSYRVDNVSAYFAAVQEPINALRNRFSNTLREVVAEETAEELLTDDHEALAKAAQKQLQQQLAALSTGLVVEQVEISKVSVPTELAEAYAGLEQARQQVATSLDKVEQQRDEELSRITDAAQDKLDAARQQRDDAIVTAKIDARQFESQLAAFQQAPDIMKTELYFATLEKLFAQSAKVFVMQEQGEVSLSLDDVLTNSIAYKRQQADAANDKSAAQDAAAKRSAPSLYDVPAVEGEQ